MGIEMKKSGVNELMSYQSINMGESLPSKCKILYKWGKHTKVGIYLTWENINNCLINPIVTHIEIKFVGENIHHGFECIVHVLSLILHILELQAIN